MQAILKFKLPEERVEFEQASNSGKLYNILWELDQYLRTEIKYKEHPDDKHYQLLETLRTKLHELMSEENISF